MPSVHAFLSPSASKRWIECPPSLTVGKRYPVTESEAAAEGTLAHEIAECLIRKHFDPDPLKRDYYAVWLRDLTKHKLYHTSILSDMYDFVAYVVEVFNKVKAIDPTAVLYTEKVVHLNQYAPGSFGTCDIRIVAQHILIVIDLKYGKGVEVEAKGNTQLMMYSLGALNELTHPVDVVEMHIYQPRMYGAEVATISAYELIQWGLNVLRPAAFLAVMGYGEYKAGNHCRFCPAKMDCGTYLDYVTQIFTYMYTDFKQITPEQIAHILKLIPDAKRWVNAFEDNAVKVAATGTPIPGYKLVRKHGRRTIVDVKRAAGTLLFEGYKPETIYNTELKGITELENILGKKRFNALLGPVVNKPDGSPELAPLNDKREPLNRANEVKNIFSGFMSNE
jgi:hypothetical protein